MDYEANIELAVIEWLTEGFRNKAKHKSHLADLCDVSRQAVGDWVKNGKVNKRHFINISNYLELPIPKAALGGGIEEPSLPDWVNGEGYSKALLPKIQQTLIGLGRDLTKEEFNLLSGLFDSLNRNKCD